jgi:hypothetical protein
MRRHVLMLAAVLALLLSIHTGQAFDPRKVDLLMFRLGMSEEQVASLFAVQGIPMESLSGQRHACPTRPKGGCLATVTAPTRDGVLELHFRADEAGGGADTLDRIVYRLRFHTLMELHLVRESVLARYGMPTVQNPPTWCAAPNDDGACPADQSRLTFQIGVEPTSGGTLTLVGP